MTPQLRFPEFTDEWQVKKLGDYYKLQGGYAFESVQYKKHGIPIIRISNISNVHNFIDKSNLTYHEKIPKDDQFTIKDGNLLVAMSGATTGKASVYNLGVNGYLNQRVGLFREISKSSYGFLVQFVFSSRFDNQLDRVLVAGAQPNISSKDIENFQWVVPSKPEQEKIADFLTAVDERIGVSEKKLELLETYKRGVMQKIFSQKIRFKDENGNEYPEWQEKRLGEIGETYNGLTGKAGDDFGNGSPFITYMQIFSNSKISGKFGKVRISANEKQNTVKYGDIFFTTSSETPEETGFTSVLLDNLENTYLNSFCFGYRVSKNQLLPEFARYLFHSVGVRSAIVRLAQGSTRYNISKIALMNMAIFLPSHKEQQKIATFLTALDDKITAEKSKLTAAKQFKKALLQRMFV